MSELEYAIRSVLARNLTDELRLQELKRMGFEMSRRTYERRKRHFREDLQTRLDQIANKEFASYYLDAIDKMRMATDTMMELFESDDVEIQIAANKELRENLKLLSDLYDSHPIIDYNVQEQRKTLTKSH